MEDTEELNTAAVFTGASWSSAAIRVGLTLNSERRTHFLLAFVGEHLRHSHVSDVTPPSI